MELIDGLLIVTVTLLAWLTLKNIVLKWFFSPEEGGKREEILACPRCGGRNITALKHVKHWLKRFGPIMGVYTCLDCGYEGPPVSFNSLGDYRFYRETKDEVDSRQAQDNDSQRHQ